MRLQLHCVLGAMISGIPDQDTDPYNASVAARLKNLRYAAEFGPPGLKEDLMYEAIGIAIGVYRENPTNVQPWMEYINDLLIEYHRQERGYPVRDVPKPPSVEAAGGSWRDKPGML